MVKNSILIIITALMFASCDNTTKQKEQSNETTSVEVPKPPRSLIISFGFKTNKEDFFKVMMNNIIVDELQSKSIHITEKVSPSTDFDSIVAEFDPENISQDIVINLGNAETKEVQIKNIDVSYGDLVISATTASELYDNFAFNKHITFDSITNTIKTSKVDGTHTPTIILRRKVINSLLNDK